MNVSLPNPMKDWVEDQIESGLYSNASDYVRDLIHQDQDCQNKRELLVRALKKAKKAAFQNELWMISGMT